MTDGRGEDARDAGPRDGERRRTFGRQLRLTRAREFERVYATGRRRTAGPLHVRALPNGLPHCRLGLSVSRRVGGAVVRSRIKRRLREAFRELQHDLPRGYDLVIGVRRHAPLAVAEYERLLQDAVGGLHRAWTSRDART